MVGDMRHLSTMDAADRVLRLHGIGAVIIEPLVSVGGIQLDPVFQAFSATGTYLVRLVSEREWSRFEHQPYGDDMLAAQLRFGDFVRANGVPFQRRIARRDQVWADVVASSRRYRGVVFEWIHTGDHIQRPGVGHCRAIGALVRRLHELASSFPAPSALGRQSLTEAARQAVSDLTTDLRSSGPPGTLEERLASYLDRISQQVDRLGNDRGTRMAVHGDLNFPNVLFEGDRIVGVIDIGQIHLADPLDELAWVMKWYSRSDGIGGVADNHSLALAVLAGYDAAAAFTAEQLARLPDLVWLASCVNGNFVHAAEQALHNSDHDALSRLLDRYEARDRALTVTPLRINAAR